MTIVSPSTLINGPGYVSSGQTAGAITPVQMQAVVSSLAGVALSSQSGASYTITATDIGTVIEVTVTAPNTAIIFIPTNASVAFDIGTTIEIYQAGTGQVGVQAVAPGTTTILSSTATYTTYGQYSSIGIRKRATDVWVVAGERSASVFVPTQGNYITSQDPSNAFWTATDLTATTPDILRETATTTVHNTGATSVMSRTAGSHIFCFFADFTPVNQNWVRLTVWDGSFADTAFGWFNVTGCTAGTTGAVTWTSVSTAVLPMGGSKVRCLLYFTTDGSTTNFANQVAFSPDGSTTTYLGNTANGFNMDNVFLYNTAAGAGGF